MKNIVKTRLSVSKCDTSDKTDQVFINNLLAAHHPLHIAVALCGCIHFWYGDESNEVTVADSTVTEGEGNSRQRHSFVSFDADESTQYRGGRLVLTTGVVQSRTYTAKPPAEVIDLYEERAKKIFYALNPLTEDAWVEQHGYGPGRALLVIVLKGDLQNPVAVEVLMEAKK